MFYGRDRELALLEERYNSDRFEFLPVYGRRRVGKTRLLREFMAKHEGVFFTAKTRGLKENMDEFASKVYGADVSASLTSILDTIEKRSRDRRFVLVIDEYPRLLSKDRSVGDTLQEFIDRIHEDSKLFLILCGSSISVMEHEVLGYKSPLYGRRTGSLELLPLSVWESMEFLRGFDRDDSLRIYGMVGGIPMYLGLFDPSYS
ncbi:MAG: AAA family ATPase, partial [Candidatus Methanomethylophilaceae archaeon]|nr:AAA family ATPase [Candidatus Methanomethylophilaceae archaeon]